MVGCFRAAYVNDPDHNVVEFWTWDASGALSGVPRAVTPGAYGL